MSKLGLYTINDNKRTKLLYEGSVVDKTGIKIDNTGAQVDLDSLLLNNNVIARSISSNAQLNDITEPLLTEVPLMHGDEQIDVNADEYSLLLSKKVPYGYSRNIDLHNCTTLNKELPENVENVVNEDGSLGATYENPKPPVVNVMYFNAVLKPNEELTLEYFVDNTMMDGVKRDIFKDTFTVNIYDKEDNLIASKTTYAGKYKITLPTTLTSELGESWFSVKCIDNHGVGSGVEYFDFYVKEETPNYYRATLADLNFTYNGKQYSIVPNSTDLMTTYNNKLGFTAFFKHVKEDLLDEHGNHYNGVILPKNTYYICYYKDSAFLGDFKSYSALPKKAREGHRASVTAKNTATNTNVTTYYVWRNNSWVEGTSDTVCLVDKEFYEVKVDSTSKVSNVTTLTESGMLAKYKEGKKIKKLSLPNDAPALGTQTTLSSGVYYYMYCLAKDGDNIQFPNNFTIDLNESTIRGIPAYELSSGRIIDFYDIIDTHIRNGKIVGAYLNYDFDLGNMYQNVSHSSYMTPSQYQANVFFTGARFCSMEYIDCSYALGYDGSSVIAERYTSSNFASYGTAWGPEIAFRQQGAIGPNGDEVECDYMLRSDYVKCGSYSEEIVIGSNGGVLFRGDKFNIFVAFYDEDKKLIKYVKTNLFATIKFPEGTVYVRACGYKNLDGTFPNAHTIKCYAHPKNCSYENCYFHDTRTIAVMPAYAINILYKNNRYSNIARSGSDGITRLFGDIEDSYWYCRRTRMENCVYEGSSGHIGYVVGHVQHFEFVNNIGIAVEFRSATQFAYISGCKLPGLAFYDLYKCWYYPHLLIDKNIITTMGVGRYTITDPQDTPDSVVPLTNCKILNYCGYGHLHMHNCENGDEIID